MPVPLSLPEGVWSGPRHHGRTGHSRQHPNPGPSTARRFSRHEVWVKQRQQRRLILVFESPLGLFAIRSNQPPSRRWEHHSANRTDFPVQGPVSEYSIPAAAAAVLRNPEIVLDPPRRGSMVFQESHLSFPKYLQAH